ncbi:MAG TPA: hypothetical protein VFS05_14800 [Gemmatimonadaceae bacterium]|nr:hypothetical protein [Gemmatimonadaceae bacterium]
MYAPALLPDARPSDAVLAVEAQLLAAEGPLYAGGLYCGTEDNAARRRRQIAERIVARAEGR